MTLLTDDICNYLQAQGVGTVGTNLFSGTHLPDQPDAAVVVVEHGGAQPLMTLTGESLAELKIDQPTFQVRVRDTETGYASGEATAQAIFKALHGVTETTLVAGGALFHLIVALQSPFHLGRDEKQRHEWAQNFRALYTNPNR